jgi:hypothetical protein
MSGEGVLVGLDVAKATLDVAVRPTGESWQVTNDDTGIGELVLSMLHFKVDPERQLRLRTALPHAQRICQPQGRSLVNRDPAW